MTAYAVAVPERAPVPPLVEDLLEDAVYACRAIAHDPAQVAAALEGTLRAAELLMDGAS